MAQISFEQIINLITASTDWEKSGWEPPETVLDIRLAKRTESREDINSELAGKTVTYEGYDTTVVLDFDDKGYLVNIQFI